MELPIDHFRLLGVSPTTDGETVLRTLQQRLDRAPDQGFTHDTLQARAELLRSSAELLSDDERRQHYERELTTIADNDAAAVAGLEIPTSREVGGLLLLMEAGQAQEAFDAASRGLQPPQAPALGSSREADLTLLAGLACQAAAIDYRSQRHYETAARTLQQGLQLLQRMGQMPEQRRRLEQELQALQPYRVLDLCAGDIGLSAARTFDLEVYSPGVDLWLEVSSVSWCSDYQARRANIRYRPEAGGGPAFVHTLNGSALAWARIWAALVETGRQADGSVVLPDVLAPYLGGRTVIGPAG